MNWIAVTGKEKPGLYAVTDDFINVEYIAVDDDPSTLAPNDFCCRIGDVPEIPIPDNLVDRQPKTLTDGDQVFAVVGKHWVEGHVVGYSKDKKTIFFEHYEDYIASAKEWWIPKSSV